MKSLGLSISLAAAALLSSCVSGEEQTAAEGLVNQFYQSVAARDYGAVYAIATMSLQGQATPEQLAQMMEDQARAWGQCAPPVRDRGFHNVTRNQNGDFMQLRYRLDCNRGTRVDTFEVRLDGGPRLQAYRFGEPETEEAQSSNAAPAGAPPAAPPAQPAPAPSAPAGEAPK